MCKNKIDEIALKHTLPAKYLDSQMYDVNSVKNAMVEYANFILSEHIEKTLTEIDNWSSYDDYGIESINVDELRKFLLKSTKSNENE